MGTSCNTSSYTLYSEDERAAIINDLTRVEGSVVRFTPRAKELALIPFLDVCSKERHVPLHSHDYLELVMILEGRGTHIVGARAFDVHKGDVFFLNNDVPHGFTIDKGTLSYVNFAFLPTMLHESATLERLRGGLHFFLIEPFFRSDDAFQYRLTLTDAALDRLSSLAFLIIDAFNRAYPAKSDALSPLFTAFITLIHEEYTTRIKERPHLYQKREALVKEIIAFVEDRLDEKFTLADVACAVGLGRTRISEAFKGATGETIIEYTMRRRVEGAARLLRESDAPVLTVALDAGFNDLSHFNHTFRKHFAMTPSEYRKMT